MVEIGGKPILYHVMSHYAKYGYKDFLLALGYKSEVIKTYFMDFSLTNSDFRVSMSTNELKTLTPSNLDWDILLLNTGSSTMTGGRVKRMEKYVGSERFMLTYGDGVSDVNLKNVFLNKGR